LLRCTLTLTEEVCLVFGAVQTATHGVPPFQHASSPGYLATPAVFQCANMRSAHEFALMLRHGPGGLAGPGASPGQEATAWQILRLQSDTMSYY
jgi:hypothetical protein